MTWKWITITPIFVSSQWRCHRGFWCAGMWCDVTSLGMLLLTVWRNVLSALQHFKETLNPRWWRLHLPSLHNEPYGQRHGVTPPKTRLLHYYYLTTYLGQERFHNSTKDPNMCLLIFREIYRAKYDANTLYLCANNIQNPDLLHTNKSKQNSHPDPKQIRE